MFQALLGTYLADEPQGEVYSRGRGGGKVRVRFALPSLGGYSPRPVTVARCALGGAAWDHGCMGEPQRNYIRKKGREGSGRGGQRGVAVGGCIVYSAVQLYNV